MSCNVRSTISGSTVFWYCHIFSTSEGFPVGIPQYFFYKFRCIRSNKKNLRHVMSIELFKTSGFIRSIHAGSRQLGPRLKWHDRDQGHIIEDHTQCCHWSSELIRTKTWSLINAARQMSTPTPEGSKWRPIVKVSRPIYTIRPHCWRLDINNVKIWDWLYVRNCWSCIHVHSAIVHV